MLSSGTGKRGKLFDLIGHARPSRLISFAAAVPATQWLRHLLVAAVLVPMMLFAVFAALDRQHVLAQADDRARRIVDILYEHARNVFRMHEAVLGHLDDRIAGKSWQEINDSEELHRYLVHTVEQNQEVSSIWLIDPNGHHRSSSFGFPIPPRDVSDRDYFRALKEPGAGTYIGEVIVGKTNTVASFTVSRRRSSPSGDFDGVISIAITPTFFTDFYAQIVRDPSRAISLVRADGTVLARDPPTPNMEYKYSADSAFMKALGAAEEGVFWGRGDMDGVERLYAYRKLAGFPVFVMMGLGETDILAAWHRNLAVYAAYGVPAWLLLVFVAAIALRRAKREEAAAAALREEMARRELAEAALMRTQRMEALGQLTGGIAHDFNNLLTVINGNLDLIGSKIERRLAGRIEAVRRAAHRGERLTQQLLAFARRQTLEPESIDLAAGIRGMAELLDRSLRGDIKTEFELVNDLWPVETDRAQLEMAVLNIAMNARDAMPAGGTLKISARNVAGGMEGRAADLVALTISDTGTGMAPSVIERAFEPFFSTKEVGKGTGLGLSQVYGFVKQSGGDIQIDSKQGKGTSITLYLPRARSAAPSSVPAAERRTKWNAPATILVVEDDDAVAELAQLALEENGYHVRLARNAAEALRMLSAEAVDLVFSDVVMPGGMNGLELATEIRRIWPLLPVLLTTGYSDVASTAGAADFPLLAKPYRATAVTAAIASALEASQRQDSVSGPRARSLLSSEARI